MPDPVKWWLAEKVIFRTSPVITRPYDPTILQRIRKSQAHVTELIKKAQKYAKQLSQGKVKDKPPWPEKKLFPGPESPKYPIWKTSTQKSKDTSPSHLLKALKDISIENIEPF